MGILFSKPLTEDNLAAAMQPILDAALDAALKPIKDDIAALKDALLVPDGDEEAKKATVVIKTIAAKGESILGHGVVVRAPDYSGNDGMKYYLLSAAHVLVDIAASSEGVSISWSANVALSFEEREPEAIIFHLDYISNGSHDYGFMELKSMPQIIIDSHLKTKALRLGSPGVGQSVVARGKVFLRGTVTGVIDESCFSVLAHFVPGSRGAPIFNNQCQLIGLVHGSSKHKGHAYCKSEDDAAVVYADAILVNADNSLHPIFKEHWKWLSMAEDVPFEVASGEKKLVCKIITDEHGQEVDVVETEGTQYVWRLIEELHIPYKNKSELSLKKVMKALKEKVLEDQAIPRNWNDTSAFELVFVSD